MEKYCEDCVWCVKDAPSGVQQQSDFYKCGHPKSSDGVSRASVSYCKTMLRSDCREHELWEPSTSTDTAESDMNVCRRRDCSKLLRGAVKALWYVCFLGSATVCMSLLIPTHAVGMIICTSCLAATSMYLGKYTE